MAAVGEEIILARDGEPVARLIPVESKTSPRARAHGALRGQIKIAPDFDGLPTTSPARSVRGSSRRRRPPKRVEFVAENQTKSTRPLATASGYERLNCDSSVEPFTEVVSDSPPVIAIATSSK